MDFESASDEEIWSAYRSAVRDESPLGAAREARHHGYSLPEFAGQLAAEMMRGCETMGPEFQEAALRERFRIEDALARQMRAAEEGEIGPEMERRGAAYREAAARAAAPGAERQAARREQKRARNRLRRLERQYR